MGMGYAMEMVTVVALVYQNGSEVTVCDGAKARRILEASGTVIRQVWVCAMVLKEWHSVVRPVFALSRSGYRRSSGLLLGGTVPRLAKARPRLSGLLGNLAVGLDGLGEVPQ